MIDLAERIIQKIENANSHVWQFACDADREEAVEIVADELRAMIGKPVLMIQRDPDDTNAVKLAYDSREDAIRCHQFMWQVIEASDPA